MRVNRADSYTGDRSIYEESDDFSDKFFDSDSKENHLLIDATDAQPQPDDENADDENTDDEKRYAFFFPILLEYNHAHFLHLSSYI